MSPEAALGRLLTGHRDGYALEQAFHVDPAIYALELDRVWRRGWLFATPSCELAGEGAYEVLDLADDSIVLVRDGAGVVHGLRNTCRHRGMRLCDGSGRARRLVCPYHQWSYAPDGSLLGCGGMEREGLVDRAATGLAHVPVEEVGGLVFVHLGERAPPFAPARDSLAAPLEPQGLAQARVAATRDYLVGANWKLVWENNRECWHCHVGHPDYVRANYDTADPADERVRARAEARAAAVSATLERHGVHVDHGEPGLYRFPSAGRWWSVNRTPLTDGFVTESLDGEAVGPVMGTYPSVDVGTLRVRTLPNFWSHASGDHAVLTRLLPESASATRVRVQWLVDEHAVEGVDYELERLLPFWQRTSEQDWALCERNHAGVATRGYRPGPYSRRREYNVIAFVEWYLGALAGD